jgi:hypothetical protein
MDFIGTQTTVVQSELFQTTNLSAPGLLLSLISTFKFDEFGLSGVTEENIGLPEQFGINPPFASIQ